MNPWTISRLLSTVAAVTLTLAACASSDEPAASAESEPADTAETTTSTTEPTAIESSTTTVDERTDEEIAIDQLDLMLVQLRTVDLIATADCVVERLESQGIEVVGQGAPEIIAALGCEPELGNQLFATARFGFSEDENACVVDELVAASAAVPLDEAEAFFSASTPPEGVLEAIASECGVPLDQLTQGFN